ESGERLAQEPRAAHATVAQPALVRRIPAPPADALAGEMDDGVEPFQRLALERPGRRVPAEIGGRWRGAAREPQDVVPWPEVRDERRAQEPRRPGDENLHPRRPGRDRC